MLSLMPRPIVLTILDGWGYRPETTGNAIALARKPVYDGLLRDFPNTLIRASDHFVGLPDGQMGNSEVGHLNLGAGRVVHMDVTRIDVAIGDGTFFRDPTFMSAINIAQATLGSKISIMTLEKKKLAIRIPPGTSAGKRLRVAGHGIKKDDRVGDLIVQVDVVVPEKLTEEQEKAMKEFAEASGLKY